MENLQNFFLPLGAYCSAVIIFIVAALLATVIVAIISSLFDR